MAFARPKPDANSEGIHQRYTELSDVIRARNKREDRLLNVRIKFYERERNIRINIIRKEQRQLERVRTSILEDAKKMQLKTQNFPLPVWMSPRPQSECHRIEILSPEFIIDDDWELNSNLIQPEIMPLNITDNKLSTKDVMRRHSAR